MTSTFPRRETVPIAPNVGDYRLLSRIGEGGMGVVHLAQGPDGRRAALKVLRPNVVGDDESRRRLAQEVESLRHVRSRHVAEILDADPWGDVPFVVTRFVPGHSLQAVVDEEGPLAGDDLVHAARGLLGAVHDVHAAQVLHRDIKPTNVVMEGRSPILIDFGLARLAEDPRLTATGLLMGSPGYLAPEVLFGNPASAATDVHGWAATIVYAATGHSPYGVGHMMTLLDRTRRGELDLSGVPDRWRPLLAGALAPQPHERPTVREAMAALDRLPAGPRHTAPPVARQGPPPQPVPQTRPYTVVGTTRPQPGPATTPPYPWVERLSGWARFRRSTLLLALAAVVVTCFGTAPYLTTAVVTALVLLARGTSHSRQATGQRRSVRGRKWYDGPLALLGYPWHVVRGSLGGLALVLVAACLAATTVGVLVLAGALSSRALLAGGVVLALGTWWGPGSARVREPVRRLATGVARLAAVWCLVVATLGGLAAAVWWVGHEDGVQWAPANQAPWEPLQELAELTGIAETGL